MAVARVWKSPVYITAAGLYLCHNLPTLLILNYNISYQIGIPMLIFMARCINLHDIIVLSSNCCIPYLGKPGQAWASLCTCMPATCMQNWAFCGVANHSSAVWRYFSITDEGKFARYVNKQDLLVDKKRQDY